MIDVNVSFGGDDDAAKDVWAGELVDHLRRLDVPLTITRARQNRHAQDFGALVVIALSSPAIAAVATGIASWIGRRRGVEVEVEADGKRLSLKNVDLETAEKAIARILGS